MAAHGSFDEELVEAAQAGDEEAREKVLAGIEPIFRAFFIRRIGKTPDVDDLVQNALLRVHNGLGRLRNPSRLKAFAMKAAVFELHDLYRGRYGLKERTFPPDVLPEDTNTDGRVAARIDAEKLLGVLTPRARRILELRAYGYRYREIAGMIDSTEAAIKMQVKRAFDAMREVVGMD